MFLFRSAVLLASVLLCQAGLAVSSVGAGELSPFGEIVESPGGVRLADVAARARRVVDAPNAGRSQIAAASYVLALRERETGNSEAAVGWLERSGRAAPDSRHWIRVVWDLLGLGAVAQARAVLDRDNESSANPSSAAARALIAVRDGDLSGAREWLDRSEGASERKFVMAEWHAANKDLPSAITAMKSYLVGTPWHRTLAPRAYRLQAKWLEQTGREPDLAYGSALLAYRLANPRTDEALAAGLLTARFAILFGQPTVAAAVTTELAESFPDSATLHNLRAYSLAAIGLVEQSDQALKLGATTPEDVYRLAAKARLATWRNDCAQALRLWNGILSASSSQAFALHEKAVLLATCPDKSVRNGRLALECSTRATELTHQQVWTPFLSRAYAHMELGNFDAAGKALVRYSLQLNGFDHFYANARRNALANQPMRFNGKPSTRWPWLVIDGTGIKQVAVASESKWVIAAAKRMREIGDTPHNRMESFLNQSYAMLVLGDVDAAIQVNEQAASCAGSEKERAFVWLARFIIAIESNADIPSAVEAGLQIQFDRKYDWLVSLILFRSCETLTPEKRTASLKTARESIEEIVGKRRKSAWTSRNADNYEILVEVYVASGDWSSALRSIDRTLGSYRVHETAFAAKAWLLRARVLLELGDVERAMQNAAVAWRLDQKLRGYAGVVSRIHLAAGRLSLARYWSEEALKEAADDPVLRAPLLARLAEIAQRNGDQPAMLRHLTESSRLLETPPKIWREHEAIWTVHLTGAKCLLRAHRDRDALRFLDRALETAVESPEAAILKTRLLACSADASVRDGAAALQLAGAWESRAGLNAQMIAARACALAETGDFAGAVSSLKSAQFLLGEDSPGLDELGRLKASFQRRQPDRHIPPIRVATNPVDATKPQ